MSGNLKPGIRRRARRWTSRTSLTSLLATSTLAVLVLASATPVAASMQPPAGGLDDLRGGDEWSGWSRRPASRWTAPGTSGSEWSHGFLLAAGLMAHLDQLHGTSCSLTEPDETAEAGCPVAESGLRGWR